MYIGPHRNYPHHLFALGSGGDSITGAFVAARHAARALRGAGRQRRRRVRLGAMMAPASVSPVDLLAIGPHPDDIEIGIGGTVAKHAALGFRVGLCDLTAGEMGSNGTPDDRARGSRGGAAGARRRLARQPSAARSRPWRRCRAGSCGRGPRAPRPAAGRGAAVLGRPASGSRRGEPPADRRRVQRRAAPVRGGRRRVEARVGLLLLHQRLGAALVRR